MKKQDAIKHFGGSGKLASALGILPCAVSQWGEVIPELRVYQIERLINSAKENNVEVSLLRINKEGRVTYKVPKGGTPLCVQRELKRLSIQNETARG